MEAPMEDNIKSNKQGNQQENSKQAEKAKSSSEKIKSKEDKKTNNKIEEKADIKKIEEKAEAKEKPSEEKLKKKDEAAARGISLHLSKKHCMYICDSIKNKKINEAIKILEDVLAFKRPISFRGEIPHRKHSGIMSGRFPINASKAIISVLKGLKANSIVNGLDIERTRIFWASASWASRPSKRTGGRFKRAHITFKAKEMEANK